MAEEKLGIGPEVQLVPVSFDGGPAGPLVVADHNASEVELAACLIEQVNELGRDGSVYRQHAAAIRERQRDPTVPRPSDFDHWYAGYNRTRRVDRHGCVGGEVVAIGQHRRPARLVERSGRRMRCDECRPSRIIDLKRRKATVSL
jgi:hypothetical protein